MPRRSTDETVRTTRKREQSENNVPPRPRMTSPDMAACTPAPGVEHYLQSALLSFNRYVMDVVVFEQSSGGEHTSVFEAVVQEAGISALLEVVGDRILRV